MTRKHGISGGISGVLVCWYVAGVFWWLWLFRYLVSVFCFGVGFLDILVILCCELSLGIPWFTQGASCCSRESSFVLPRREWLRSWFCPRQQQFVRHGRKRRMWSLQTLQRTLWQVYGRAYGRDAESLNDSKECKYIEVNDGSKCYSCKMKDGSNAHARFKKDASGNLEGCWVKMGSGEKKHASSSPEECAEAQLFCNP